MNVGAGLKNVGNTCFLNAALQAVLHTKSLMKILAERKHSRQSHCVGWCVFCQLQCLFQMTSNTRVCAPSKLIYNLPRIFKKFRLGRQEDSHEFLRYLLQGMQDAETGKLQKQMHKQNETTIRNTNIFSIFGGLIKTSVQCFTCSARSITVERYYDLNIECQRANTLQEGLKYFFLPGKLEGANKYYCEKCKNRTNAVKRMFLDTIPQVMTFQFKRFTNFMRKISKFINYPSQFNAGLYLEQPCKVTMRLYAIIVHAGGSSYSGHYYAFVKTEDKWFKMDDSYVSKCTLQTIMTQNAYILFYQKVHQQKKQQLIQKDIKNLKQASCQKMLNQSSKNKNDIISKTIINQLPIKINGHAQIKVMTKEPIKITMQRQKKDKVQKQNANEQNLIQQQSESESIEMPRLERRTSKEEAQSKLTILQLILKYSLKLADLKQQNKKKKPINKSLRRRYDLRRYESKIILKKSCFGS